MPKNEITLGAKIELKKRNSRNRENAEGIRTYYSKVLDISDAEEGTVVKASMPIFEGHVVPLSIGEEYDIYFSVGGNIIESTCKVAGRSKEANIYVMDLLVTGELRRVQRREFYRMPCDIAAAVQIINEWQAIAYERTHEWKDALTDNARESSTGKIIDLSGGGLRMRATTHYDKDEWVKITFDICCNDKKQTLEILGKVIASYLTENNRSIYETRVQFKALSKERKETIIKYIFQEQRRIQQKSRG
ncbi:MAG: PilZ domain-containing protein [Clostridia bacterium]|nr:PilZ domain-containing protein [Clostridia bacterium]